MSINAINSFQTTGLGGANGYLASLFGAGRGLGLASLAGQGLSSAGRFGQPVEPANGFSTTFPGRRSESPGAYISTAYQRSSDGDEAFLSSKFGGLTPEERQTVTELSARDIEVRTHELAHIAAAGSLVKGGASYEFTSGPDGKRYAVSGSVEIDTSAGRTPEETLAKAQRIRAAALAPSEPSGADLSIAAEAAQLEIDAQKELASAETISTDGIISDGENETIDSGGETIEPVLTPSDSGDTVDTSDEGDVTDETGETFARGSANSAFNRTDFPGRGNAFGHFNNAKNANAVANSAHGFSFETDTSATTDPVEIPIDDSTSIPVDEPIEDPDTIFTEPDADVIGSDTTQPDGGTDTTVSGGLNDGADDYDPFSVLTGGELDLIG